MRCYGTVYAGGNYSVFTMEFESIKAARDYFNVMREDGRLPGERLRLVGEGAYGQGPEMALYHPDCYIKDLGQCDGYPFRIFSVGPRGGLVEEAT